MKITYEGSSSGNGGCPTLYRTVHGTAVIQGTTVNRAALPDLGAAESAVEVPAELLRFVDAGTLPPLAASTAVGRGILYRTERDTLVVLGVPVTDDEAIEEMCRHGNGIPPYESAVEVATGLLAAVDVPALPLVELDPSRPQFDVDPALVGEATA